RKATVRLGGDGQPLISYVESSGPDGSFRFENVGPGRYTVLAQKQGFSSLPPGTLPALVLSAGESKRDVEIRLTPLSVVTGVVLDFDGDPVQNVQVQLMRRGYTQGRMRLQVAAAGMSDDRGRYRITGVAAGRYYLYATDSAARYARESHSGSRP